MSSMTNQISRDEMRSFIEDKLCAHFGVTSLDATDEQVFQASAIVIREIMSRVLAFEGSTPPEREVHYLSMEFLMGRSLMKNAFNLGVSEALTGALEDMGRNASMATQDIPATGYSLCYELGMFRQKIENGRQTEVADNWRTAAEGWLVPRYEDAVEVRFGGRVEPHWDQFGHYHGELMGYETVVAVPRDMLIAGYDNTRVNTLRLWEAHSTNDLDMYSFATGDYMKALENRTMAEVITKVLYPADDHLQGKTLRLRQQYFFVSATAQSIVRAHRARFGTIRNFAEHHVIQINDTHPTLMIPELMRIFMDEDNLEWDEAWKIVTECFDYTNHTVMSEALETWPQGLIQSQMPRIWEIICEINRRWCDYLREQFGDDERVGRNLIIAEGKVHMANMCLATCKIVNGVSALHGDILKKDLFKDVCGLNPARFTFVTNGIDHRRWLAQINPGLHSLVCELLGSDDYLLHPEKMADLAKFATEREVQLRLEAIKLENKQRLAKYLANDGFVLNTDAILDTQVKRLHEYKRQLLCAMLITHLQQRPRKRREQRPRLQGQTAGAFPRELPCFRRRDPHARRPGVRADLHRRQGGLRHRQHEDDDERSHHDRHARRRERRDVRAPRRREHVPLRSAHRSGHEPEGERLLSAGVREPQRPAPPRPRAHESRLLRRRELFRSRGQPALRRRPVYAPRGLRQLC